MTTIAKTTAQAVGRKLRSLNFEPYNYATGIGCSVWQDGNRLTVVNHTYTKGTAAKELVKAGYIIENLYHSGDFAGRHMESFTVAGRVEA
jgi:hypothetical protein